MTVTLLPLKPKTSARERLTPSTAGADDLIGKTIVIPQFGEQRWTVRLAHSIDGRSVLLGLRRHPREIGQTVCMTAPCDAAILVVEPVRSEGASSLSA